MSDDTLRDAVTRMHLAAAQIERDVRLTDLTADEWRTLAEAAWNTRPSSPAATDGDLEDEVAVFLRAYGDAFVREVLKQAAPVSDGGAVREALRTAAYRLQTCASIGNERQRALAHQWYLDALTALEAQ